MKETPRMTIYVALRSVPDYHAPAPDFVSVNLTLAGAIEALYPGDEKAEMRAAFRASPHQKDVWDGPDGFGMVKRVEVLP